jgi:arginine-tRNA-protein transferase
MSLIPSDLGQDQPFYLSGSAPCAYLPARWERKLFTRFISDDKAVNTAINAALCRVGFRRSHDLVYRPACDACNACVPVRIVAAAFAAARSERRVIARNRDLSWRIAEPVSTPALFALFRAYQEARHTGGEMAQMTAEDFAAMLQEGRAETLLCHLSDAKGALKGCVIVDAVDDGLSAVYSFYTPDAPRRSLGTALILGLIAEAQRRGLPYVYLGYWIAEADKMAYKARFQPLQFLGARGWGDFRSAASAPVLPSDSKG